MLYHAPLLLKNHLMQDLRIRFYQASLPWENSRAGLEYWTAKLQADSAPVDLIVLPEMFTTGFSMRAAELAEPATGPTLRWMQEQAQVLQAVITGSVILEEKGNYFNRLLWVRPDGSYASYDKRHLFGLAGEHEHYTAGQHRLLVQLKGWSICPLICYDLRFPVWSRNHAESPYDLAIYVANWPSRRREAWRTLLRARAIENQCYVLGVNRVGQDGNRHDYSGDSALINYAGETLCELTQLETSVQVSISGSELQGFRASLPFLKDADNFSIRN